MTHSGGRLPAILGGVAAFSAPLLLTRPRLPNRTVLDELLSGIYERQWLTNDGELVQELEARLAAWTAAPHCLLISNGTAALQIALQSLDLEGEVLTTPFTFPATVHSLRWLGLEPVFCDIDPHSYNLDPACVEHAITQRTSGVLPVHLFGRPCDVEGFERLAKQRGLGLVYDAAHCFGTEYRGKSIAAWGDLSVLSFHATKLFHTAEGGAILTSRPELNERVRLLRNFGIVNEDEVRGGGINGKLSELHAGLGLALLDEMNDEISRRSAVCDQYERRLSEIDGITCLRYGDETRANYGYMVVEIDSDGFGLTRDQLHRALRAENIHARRYFFPLCSENPAYRDLPSARPENLPMAHRVASRVLCLPLFGELGSDQVDRVVDAMQSIRAAALRIGRVLSAA